MGCDIHAYLEYRESEGDETRAPFFMCFAENIDLSRDYFLFSLMADVRSDPNRADIIPVSKPRGLPDHVSFTVSSLDRIYISDEDGDGCTTLENAERWGCNGSSKWTNDHHTSVTHPDHHSHSWLGLEDLKEVQRRYAAIMVAPISGYHVGGHYFEEGARQALGHNVRVAAVIAMMEALEVNSPGSTRLVFWFDN